MSALFTPLRVGGQELANRIVIAPMHRQRCVAKLYLSVCRDTGLSISAISAAAWQARLSWRVVRGLIRFCPGNSQPCGRASFHRARSRSRRYRESMT
jgi:hypothetical protein